MIWIVLSIDKLLSHMMVNTLRNMSDDTEQYIRFI